AKAGQRALGARLVSCLDQKPEQGLRFDRARGPVKVKLTEPEGATAYLEGDPIGRVPVSVETTAAFSRIQISDAQGNSETRVVAPLEDIEVKMPAPKPHPVPTIVAPDSLAEEAPHAALEAKPAESPPMPEATPAVEAAKPAEASAAPKG